MAHPQRRDGARGESDAPVLFLDVDGVLNIAAGVATATTAAADEAFSRLHGSLLERLARVVRRSRARVVLSSSWRHDRQRLALLERAWRVAQVPSPLDAATPTLATATTLITSVRTTTGQCDRSVDTHSRQRVLEIQQWLRDEGSEGIRWAAVDDLDLAVAATDVRDQAKFVRTDPTRGLSVHDVETLVGLLTDGEEQQQQEQTLGPLSMEVQLLRLAVDLIVVVKSDAASDATAVVVDTADFSVVACLDTAQQPLRAWLRTQVAEFSLDHIATVHLSHTNDEAVETPIGPLDIQVPTELTPEAFAFAFARGVLASASEAPTTSFKAVIKLLQEKIGRRDLAEWCGADAVMRQLREAGLSADEAAHLVGNTALATRLLDLLPTLKPLSPQRVNLAIELCRLFPHKHSRMARRTLAEYVARSEITSRAALEAARLMWTAQQQHHHVALEELDEMVAML